MAQEDIKKLTEETFVEGIKSGVVLVDFYANWCGPCRMLAPVLEQLAEEVKGKASIAKLDIDTAPTTTEGLEITSVPTMILFKNGKEVNRIVGLRDADFLLNFIRSAS